MSRTDSAAPIFVHAERDLAVAFGLHHDILRKARGQRLKRGTDWDLVKSIVCYSEPAREKMQAVLKISSGGAGLLPPPGRALALAAGGRVFLPDGVALFIGSADSAPNTCGIGALVARLVAADYVAPTAGEIRELECAGTVKNTHVVRARDGLQVAWIRVKTSKNFRAGMKIQAEFVEGSLWTFVGRLPRWPGKY